MNIPKLSEFKFCLPNSNIELPPEIHSTIYSKCYVQDLKNLNLTNIDYYYEYISRFKKEKWNKSINWCDKLEKMNKKKLYLELITYNSNVLFTKIILNMVSMLSIKFIIRYPKYRFCGVMSHIIPGYIFGIPETFEAEAIHIMMKYITNSKYYTYNKKIYLQILPVFKNYSEKYNASGKKSESEDFIQNVTTPFINNIMDILTDFGKYTNSNKLAQILDRRNMLLFNLLNTLTDLKKKTVIYKINKLIPEYKRYYEIYENILVPYFNFELSEDNQVIYNYLINNDKKNISNISELIYFCKTQTILSNYWDFNIEKYENFETFENYINYYFDVLCPPSEDDHIKKVKTICPCELLKRHDYTCICDNDYCDYCFYCLYEPLTDGESEDGTSDCYDSDDNYRGKNYKDKEIRKKIKKNEKLIKKELKEIYAENKKKQEKRISLFNKKVIESANFKFPEMWSSPKDLEKKLYIDKHNTSEDIVALEKYKNSEIKKYKKQDIRYKNIKEFIKYIKSKDDDFDDYMYIDVLVEGSTINSLRNNESFLQNNIQNLDYIYFCKHNITNDIIISSNYPWYYSEFIYNYII